MINAREWMGAKEDEYRSRLRHASLVVEADYSHADVELILQAFGARLRKIMGSGGFSWHKAFDDYPACLLVGMVGTAATAPESNTFWPEFWRNVGHRSITEMQPYVGDLFLQALSRFRLPLFGDVVKQRFVGPAAMHAAIPAAGTGRLVDLVLNRRRIDLALTGGSLLSWLSGHDSRWDQIDRTVGRFLQHGGDLAVDVLDRVIDVVSHVREDPSSLNDGSLTTETTGLPTVMLAALADSVKDRLQDLTAQPKTVNRARGAAEAALRLDIGSGAVVLQLPSVSAEQGPARWSIAADDEVQEVRSEAQWVGRTASTFVKTVVLRRPTRSVNVRLRGAEYSDHRLVDPSDPLLFFDLDGASIGQHHPLPRGEVWALAPAGREIVDTAGAAVRVLGDLGEPVGWSGWSIRSIDVASADAVRLDGTPSSVRFRAVRKSGAPTFSTPRPITGIINQRGLSVLSERPMISLPAGSDWSMWQVEVVANAGGGRTTRRLSLAECEQRGDGLDPLTGFSEPLLGDFSISVRGSFGKKAQCLVSLAEGLDASVEPSLRRPVAGRLETATVSLSAPEGMSLSASTITFAAEEVQARLTCQVGEALQHFVVAPPSVQIRVAAEGVPPAWMASPPTVHPDMLEQAASLYVRLPGDLSHYRLELVAGQSDDRQSVEPSGRRGHDSRMFDLTRFVETARRTQLGVFSLVSPGESFPVALLRPRRFASRARPVPDGLQLEEHRHVPGLHAAVYQKTAPWVAPRQIPVTSSGLVPLPDDLLEAGPVLLDLAVVDSWVPTEWPAWPGAEAVECALPGRARSDAPGLEALSRVLAGEVLAEAPPPVDLSTVWDVLWLHERLALPDDIGRRSHQLLLDTVHRDPSAALAALMRSPRGHVAVVQLLIKSQLVERRFTDIPFDELTVGWSAAPVLAAVGAAPIVALRETDDEVMEPVRLHGGDSLAVLLTTARDPHREVGGFGAAARAMDQLSPARVAELWSAVQVVPEGLLHPDSRMAAAKQLFDVRHAPALRPVIDLVGREIGRIRRFLKDAAPESVLAQLDARLDGFTAAWQLLPAASFAWAALARLRALEPAAVLSMTVRRRDAWMQLASLAPDYVGMDVVLAEALVQSANNSNQKATA